MWPSLFAAFSLGLVGSAHCLGMCGPLVLALPLQGLGAVQRGIAVGMYHGGRIMVYTLGGLLFGLLGRRVYLAGWQQGLSIVLGLFPPPQAGRTKTCAMSARAPKHGASSFVVIADLAFV